ncbi:MFS transporter [Roseateles sp. DAIF2]|uniref:MFS transporter n=1 Tax=Roseateles sp. DAIF2 TaxID=2714952 RepID=UPI0018A2EE09|nr:MFS transporter [Roseateles sp. DAIF2]QPF74581.1 MFS transporter [Roseateles sp. DAIF2]
MRPLPLIVILLVLNHVAFNGSRIAVALFAIKQGASTLTVGSLMAVYALLPALLSVTAGRWIDRGGVNKPMLIGTAGVGLGTLAPFLLPEIGTLYFTAVLVGLAFMLINVSAYHAVGEMSAPEERTVNFSYVALGFSTSTFVAPMLTGVSIDSLGYRAAFLILSLFTVLPLLALWGKLLPEQPRPERKELGPRGHVFELLRDREVRRLFIAMAILTVGWDIYNFAIPVYGAQIGLSPSQIGIVMGAFAAATFAVRLAMPFIAHRAEPWSLLTVSLLLAGVAYVAMPFTHSVGLLMAITFVLGLGLGAPQPTVLTLLHQSAPAGRAAEALGLRTTMINTSQTVMPLLFGAMGAALGVAPLFWGMAAMMLGGSVFARRR